MPFAFQLYKVVFFLFRLLPVRDKVVATTMRGRKYADNPRFIIEALHEINPNLDIVWFVDDRWPYDLPDWVRSVPYYKCGMLKRIYEMATAKVWINSHMFEIFVKKKKCQLFIQTFHGTLALKKLYKDMPKEFDMKSMAVKELLQTSAMTDVFLSDSEFNNEMFRRAFDYQGTIYQCGYPRNDELVKPTRNYKEEVRKKLCLTGKKIFLYVPTFRDDFERTHIIDYNVYDVDFMRLHETLVKKFGGEWEILVKFHPIMQPYVDDKKYFRYPCVKNVTAYVNVQALLAASDFVMTDYSSSIIDAALAGVPGFTFCKDFDEYKKERDVYFEMDELPFPFATDNERLIENVANFDREGYEKNWQEFVHRIGMKEPGNASVLVANKINSYIEGKSVVWTD